MKTLVIVALLILPVVVHAADPAWLQISDSEFTRLAWDDVVLVGIDMNATKPSSTLWSIVPPRELKAVATVTGVTALEKLQARLRAQPDRWFRVQTMAFPGGSPWDDPITNPAYVSLSHAYRIHIVEAMDAPGDRTAALVILRTPNGEGSTPARVIDIAERERLLALIR